MAAAWLLSVCGLATYELAATSSLIKSQPAKHVQLACGYVLGASGLKVRHASSCSYPPADRREPMAALSFTCNAPALHLQWLLSGQSTSTRRSGTGDRASTLFFTAPHVQQAQRTQRGQQAVHRRHGAAGQDGRLLPVHAHHIALREWQTRQRREESGRAACRVCNCLRKLQASETSAAAAVEGKDALHTTRQLTVVTSPRRAAPQKRWRQTRA